VMINQNETNQKVSAAVESGTMPDALDMGLDLLLLLSNAEELIDVADVYDKVGQAQGGWYESVDAAIAAEKLGGMQDRAAVRGRRQPPLQPARRARRGGADAAAGDVAADERVRRAGPRAAPLRDGPGPLQRRRRQPPGLRPQSYGGRIADDAGTTCTIKSEETRAYLEWVSAAYEKGLFPPGATTWDGAGDNTAYLSGQAIFIANTGSVSLAMNEDDPDLAASTSYSPLPAGPAGRVSPISPNVRAIPATDRRPRPGEGAARAPLEPLSSWPPTTRWRSTARSEEPGRVRGLHRPGPRRPRRLGRERDGARCPRPLQHRLRRLLRQLHRPQDGAAGRRRRLRLRPGDGRGAAAGAGDLRQVQVESRESGSRGVGSRGVGGTGQRGVSRG
jgi:multiple sugar transport system substrate-binding protein